MKACKTKTGLKPVFNKRKLVCQKKTVWTSLFINCKNFYNIYSQRHPSYRFKPKIIKFLSTPALLQVYDPTTPSAISCIFPHWFNSILQKHITLKLCATAVTVLTCAAW